MWRLLEAALDLILPRSARTERTAHYRSESLVVDIVSQTVQQHAITSLLRYQDPAVEDCIRALKYDGSAHAATLLAAPLAEFLCEEIAEERRFSPRRALIVPVPLHTARERARGFNQVTRVLAKLPRSFHDGSIAVVRPHALRRARNTPHQTHLDRDARLRNVHDAFSVKNAPALAHTHVYLIDDVTTTGATLIESARPLVAAGATVTLIALARA